MQPRNFPDQERQRLQEMASDLMVGIEKGLSSSLLSTPNDAA
jgi:hypothetical protein